MIMVKSTFASFSMFSYYIHTYVCMYIPYLRHWRKSVREVLDLRLWTRRPRRVFKSSSNGKRVGVDDKVSVSGERPDPDQAGISFHFKVFVLGADDGDGDRAISRLVTISGKWSANFSLVPLDQLLSDSISPSDSSLRLESTPPLTSAPSGSESP